MRIDPYDPTCLQPSSVDLHLDREFRVFRNSRYPFIDVRQPQPDLTELVSITDDDPFILHPANSCSARRSNGSNYPTTSSPD